MTNTAAPEVYALNAHVSHARKELIAWKIPHLSPRLKEPSGRMFLKAELF
jgi:hypothetical protein